ncbi:MAG: hypothetical protein ACWGMY_07580 [Hyphomicrobiaceae bacterium]
MLEISRFFRRAMHGYGVRRLGSLRLAGRKHNEAERQEARNEGGKTACRNTAKARNAAPDRLMPRASARLPGSPVF